MKTRTYLVTTGLWITLIGFQVASSKQQHAMKTISIDLSEHLSVYSGRLPQSDEQGIYDPKPDHIWNRLHRVFYVRAYRSGREYGRDELDPLLWIETKHLLTSPSHQQAINLVNEFLSTNAATLITDPLKRAMLQRDLWAVFNWSAQSSYQYPQQRREIQIRLAQVIRRLALSPEQIKLLPDNYERALTAKAFPTQYDPDRRETAFLPHDLFQQDSPWVCLSIRSGGPIALSHAFHFSGRSVFLVFMHLPEGRQATLAYLKRLVEFPKPWIPDQRDPDRVLPNHELPQFPAGTQLALVRQMVLIDDQGNFTPTRLTEQVQIRVHHAIPSAIPEAVNLDSNEARTSQDVFEFKLSRAKFLAGDSSGLRPVARDEREFPLFMSHGDDLFESVQENDQIERHLRHTLNSCTSCHFRPGIHSVISASRPSKLIASNPNNEANAVKWWKHNQYDWGLLQGLWQVQAR